MMKKLIGAIALLLLLFGGYKGYQYYDQTYNSQVAYAKVPEAVPPLTDTVDDSGEKVRGLKSYDYDFTFMTKDGKTIKLGYTISSEHPTPLEPNSYVKAEVSQKRVTSGPTTIDENQVPEDVLTKLK